MIVGGHTRVAGIIGSPVTHSLSPALHNAAFAACGLDWVYVAFDVPVGGAAGALAAMRSLGLGGLSVTMPHKTDVARLVDRPSAAVMALDAANTVVPGPDGALEGENTDGAGFVDSLLAHGVDPAGRSVALLGAGGAARGVLVALVAAGCTEVVVVNRSPRAARVAASLSKRARVGAVEEVTAADIVVHATPVGMRGQGGLPLDPALLRPGQVVADLVYHPRHTPLLAAATARGCTTVDGLGMLVHQGARQFTLWTGVEAPIAVMTGAVEHALAARPV